MVGSDGFVVDRISHDRHEGWTQLLPERSIVGYYEHIKIEQITIKGKDEFKNVDQKKEA